MSTLIRGPEYRRVEYGEIVVVIGDLTITRPQRSKWSEQEYRVVAPDMTHMSVSEMIDAMPWDGRHEYTVWYDLDAAIAYAHRCIAARESRRLERARVLAERQRVWPEPRPCLISRRRLIKLRSGTRRHAALCVDLTAILGVPVRAATAWTALGHYPSAIATVDGVDVPLELDGRMASVADDSVTPIG